MHITNWTVELPAKSIKNRVKVLGSILSTVNHRQQKGNLEINAEVHCSLERFLLNENKNNSGWTHLQHTRGASLYVSFRKRYGGEGTGEKTERNPSSLGAFPSSPLPFFVLTPLAKIKPSFLPAGKFSLKATSESNVNIQNSKLAYFLKK